MKESMIDDRILAANNPERWIKLCKELLMAAVEFAQIMTLVPMNQKTYDDFIDSYRETFPKKFDFAMAALSFLEEFPEINDFTEKLKAKVGPPPHPEAVQDQVAEEMEKMLIDLYRRLQFERLPQITKEVM